MIRMMLVICHFQQRLLYVMSIDSVSCAWNLWIITTYKNTVVTPIVLFCIYQLGIPRSNFITYINIFLYYLNILIGQDIVTWSSL